MHSVSPRSAGIASSIYRTRPYRHAICTLAYVRLDHANGGIIRNLSDSGMGIQAVGRLHPEQVVHLRFEFIRPRAKFELVSQVAWADANGQAGLRFTEVPLRTRRSLQDWMLTDLLASAFELKTACPVLNGHDTDDGLLVSSAPRRPIRLSSRKDHIRAGAELRRQVLKDGARLSVPWWPASIGQRALARFVDGLMVASAVLLFSLIVVELIDVVPPWPTLAGMEVLLALIFALVYRYLCHLIIECSLGTRLAELTSDRVPDKSAISSGSNRL